MTVKVLKGHLRKRGDTNFKKAKKAELKQRLIDAFDEEEAEFRQRLIDGAFDDAAKKAGLAQRLIGAFGEPAKRDWCDEGQ